MTEREDIDALAAEYVLGTLDAGERDDVNARRRHQPELDAAILDWEMRLAPLLIQIPEIAPPKELFPKIRSRLSGGGVEPGSIGPSGDVVSLLERRIGRWKRIAAAASALAACLALFIAVRETVLPSRPQSFVGVFQKDDVLPAFLLTIDLATRELTIRPVGAEPQPGKTYQLWIASDQLGPAPRSLGLIGDGAAPSQTRLKEFEPALLQRATFGVSLEPAGGSPTGRPSGTALHAKLYPASP